jgi:hypothetical protein
MIDEKTIVDAVLLSSGLNENYRKIVTVRLQGFVKALLTNQFWVFMRGSSTTTTTTDERTYTLRGADNDLDTLANVRYGTYRKLLTFESVEKFDQDRAGTSDDLSEPDSYCIRSVENAGGNIFPKIELSGKPTDDSTTIYYDYWKKVPPNIFSALPDAFQEYIINYMEYLYLADPTQKQIRKSESAKMFFDLYKRYADMSSQTPEHIKLPTEEIQRILYVNSMYGP